MRKNPVGDGAIKFGQAFLRDTLLRPKDSFRMREARADELASEIRLGSARDGLEYDLLGRTVFPNALEGCLADQPVRRPAAIFDLADQLRLCPADAFLCALGQFVPKLGLGRGNLFERIAERLRLRAGIAGAHTPSIEERSPVEVS